MKRTLKIAGLALAGLILAIGITVAASSLSSQSVGLSDESVTAGEQLVPAPATATQRPKTTTSTSTRATPTPTTPTPTPSASPPPVAQPVTPTTDDHGGDRDNSGHGSGGDDDNSGHGGGNDD